jgi:hypothetical protein
VLHLTTPPLAADRIHYPATDLRRLSGRVAITAGCMAALIAVTLLPLALHRFGRVGWSKLSDIGQAYGALAAVLTALSLGALAVSVLLQARDARTTQEHGARMLHFELVRMAINDRHLGMWRTATKRETRRQQYANLWVMLWKTLYRLGDMSDDDLRLTVQRELFGNEADVEFGHRFWERTREAYFTNIRGRRERRFYTIMEDEYRKSGVRPAHSGPHGHVVPLRRVKGHAVSLVIGSAIGIFAGQALSQAVECRRVRHR